MNQTSESKPGVRGVRHRLLGPRSARPPVAVPAEGAPRASGDPPSPAAPVTKQRVLFVCIGNSCRSQMAEAFARAYGGDILEARSAGVAPAAIIAPLTRETLAAWNLNIDDHFPKDLDFVAREPFDVVVNMSGITLARPGVRTVEWTVQDPIGQSDAVFRAVAGQIEGLVMRLILELRGGA